MKKTHTAKLTSLTLALLCVFSSLPILTNFNVKAAEYDDIMQYEWPWGYGPDPSRTRFSEGPAPDNPDLLWTAKVPEMISGDWDAVFLTFVSVFNGKAFVLSQNGTVYAFDAFTGDLEWKTPYLDVIPPDYWPGTFPAGAYKIDEQHLFVPYMVDQYGSPGGISCLNSETGELLWTMPDVYYYVPGGTALRNFPFLVEPESKMLYTTVKRTIDGNDLPMIAAFDMSDPSQPFPEVWTQQPSESPEILCYGDGKVFVGSNEWAVFALNSSTGDLIWRTQTKGFADFSGSYENGRLYHAGSSDTLTCFDGETGKILWQHKGAARDFFAWGGAAAYGKYYQHVLRREKGSFVAWDAETGEVAWSDDDCMYGIGYIEPVIADGKVFVTTDDGTVFVPLTHVKNFSAFDAESGERLWTIPYTFPNPAIAYGNLYGAFEDTLYCFGDSKPWEMWRGNIEQPGVAVGQSGPTNLTLRWKYETGGPVTSSPAIVDGTVYVGSHDKNLYALDARDGSFLWKFPINSRYKSSPAVVDNKVYIGPDDGNIYCINAETGTQLWKTPVGGIIDYVFPINWQPRSSPIIADGRLFVGALNGSVYGLDATSGTILWNYPTGGLIGGSPTFNNNVVYIASTDGNIYALSTTGSLLWKNNVTLAGDDGKLALVGSPIVAEGKVFIGGSFRKIPFGDFLVAFDAVTGDVVWKVDFPNVLGLGVHPVFTPTYANGILYFPRGVRAQAYLASNGTQLWEQFIGFQSFSSVAYADDIRGAKVYLGNELYAVTCLDATNGNPLSVYSTGAQVQSSPAIWDGKVYVGSADWNLYCFEEAPAASPEPVPSPSPEQPIEPEQPTEQPSGEPGEAPLISTEVAIAIAVAVVAVIGVAAYWLLRRRR